MPYKLMSTCYDLIAALKQLNFPALGSLFVLQSKLRLLGSFLYCKLFILFVVIYSLGDIPVIFRKYL